jgi:dTMP kinase
VKGKLIVFEGVEGCGKTTQLNRLQQWLQPRPVAVTRQPGGTELGRELRRLLLDERAGCPIQERAELFLYAADRSQHVEEFLKPQLAAGAIVLCDRYTDSTVAYQGYGRGLSLAEVETLNQIATGGLESDLTLWLDVDVGVGLARTRRRGAADRMEQADLAFHRRVREGYAALALAHPQRIVRVDASLSEDEVAEQIQTIVSQYLAC